MLLTPYARVSTTEQAKKYSIDTQLAEMEKYALDNGIELTRPHQEAKSASKTGENARPEFQRVLRDCLAGGSDGLLMCWFDRAFRNLFEFLQTKYLLRAKGKVMYLALQPMLNLEADDDDPYVTYIQNNFVNLAELQANIIGQKSRLGQMEKAKQGGWPGQTPIGYVRAEGVEVGVVASLVGVWWSGSPYHIAEAWLIALRGLDCAQMVPLLRSEDEKRSFLHRVIAARGVVIAEDGGVLEMRFRSGFERR